MLIYYIIPYYTLYSILYSTTSSTIFGKGARPNMRISLQFFWKSGAKSRKIGFGNEMRNEMHVTPDPMASLADGDGLSCRNSLDVPAENSCDFSRKVARSRVKQGSFPQATGDATEYSKASTGNILGVRPRDTGTVHGSCHLCPRLVNWTSLATLLMTDLGPLVSGRPSTPTHRISWIAQSRRPPILGT